MPRDLPNDGPTAANDEASALAALKALLLGPEQASIQRLDEEFHDHRVQAERVSDNLTEALDRTYRETPTELTDALDRPVAECLKGSVQRDPGFFADVLYPVMGPAIRRSITQAMKDLVQQINQTLEHSLTLKGLRWRLEAARSGVPFAEVVLRNTLRYRVDEVFLIQSGSGLLIQHLTRADAQAHDPDAVSGMLTAIRDFASDTFDAAASETRLETIDAGEHTLWLVHGPLAYLACAIRGIAPVGLRDELAQVIETIHRRHDDLLRRVGDDPEQADRLRPLLEPCLKSERVEPGGRRFPWPFAILALLVLAALGWWAKGLWETQSSAAADHARLVAAVEQLNASPGTLVTDWQIEQGRLLLTGLHDPLTTTPEQLLSEAGLAQTAYETAFQPFESQVPAAVLARAHQRLAPPAEVTLSLNDDGALAAAGVADAQWIDRAALLATTVPGIRAYDASALEHRDDRLRRDLSARLAPPDTVELRVADGIARFSGIAPMDWIDSLPGQVDLPNGRVILDADRLRPFEAVRLNALRRQVEQVAIPFGDGATLDPNQRPRIEGLAGLINELQQHAERLERRIRLHVIGRTDGIGTPEQNLFVARERAMVVAEALEAQGLSLPEMELNVIVLPPRAFSRSPDFRHRRVEFRLRDHGAGGPAQSANR